MKKNILLVLSFLLMIVSCEKDEEALTSIKIQSEIILSNAGGSHSIPIESDIAWTATSSESWCTVSPSSGNVSTKNITVTLSKNDSYNSRSCSIIILAGGSSKKLVVNQNAKDRLIYVSENPSGKKDGSSEENAADYLDDAFWSKVDYDLKENAVEIKFLPGNYTRIASTGGLKIESIGNAKNKLTISGNKNVVFDVEKGVVLDHLLNFTGCQNILLKDIHFTGHGSLSYVLSIQSRKGKGDSKNITIENCSWIDMGGIIHGATGCHYKGTSDITYENCTFERIGLDSHSHMMYHAYSPSRINVIDCHFEDCTGDYVRFRDNCDFGLVQNSVFIRNAAYLDHPFIAVPLFSSESNPERFATNYSFSGNEFINKSPRPTDKAISFSHSGWSPAGWNHLLTKEEGAILQDGTESERAKLFQNNFNIDVKKIRVANNTYIGEVSNIVWFNTISSQGSPSKGWTGGANITDLVNSSNEPFNWEKK